MGGWGRKFLPPWNPLSGDGGLWNTSTLCINSLPLILGSALMCAGYPGPIVSAPLVCPVVVAPGPSYLLLLWASDCSFHLCSLPTPSCLPCSLWYVHLHISIHGSLRHVGVLSRESIVELELSNFFNFKRRDLEVLSYCHSVDVTSKTIKFCY